METSHFIPTLRIGNKFREQSYLLNQSSSKILLIGDSIISNLGRYPKIWKKYFSSNNTLNFGISGDKNQHVLWRIQHLNFSNNFSIRYICILCGTNNLDHNPPEELVIMPPSYLFHYSLAVRMTQLEEETLISLTGF